MAEFSPGYVLQRGDIDIFLVDGSNLPLNVYEITYALYYVDPVTLLEILIGSATRTPVNPQIGEYYASFMVPPSATLGTYRIRWSFKQTAGSATTTVVQDFTVADKTAIVQTYTQHQMAMIWSLRVLLRDQNPDKFYKFRPPEHEGHVGQFNRVFGQIWEDAELLEYLERALDWWNMMPPETERLSTIDLLVSQKRVWRTPVLWGAIVHAATALSFNWVAEEFSYSIGGISLDIEKSSKYESLKQNAEQQLDKAAEAKLTTTKFIKGLQQSKYGLGVRSAFGPMVGRGVLSPRAFI
jgi:hypothetical protein